MGGESLFPAGSVDLIEIESWSQKTPPKKVLKELTSLAARHRVELLTQWQAIRDREGPQA